MRERTPDAGTGLEHQVHGRGRPAEPVQILGRLVWHRANDVLDDQELLSGQVTERRRQAVDVDIVDLNRQDVRAGPAPRPARLPISEARSLPTGGYFAATS